MLIRFERTLIRQKKGKGKVVKQLNDFMSTGTNCVKDSTPYNLAKCTLDMTYERAESSMYT